MILFINFCDNTYSFLCKFTVSNEDYKREGDTGVVTQVDVQQKSRTHANIDVFQGVIDIQKGMFSKRS